MVLCSSTVASTCNVYAARSREYGVPLLTRMVFESFQQVERDWCGLPMCDGLCLRWGAAGPPRQATAWRAPPPARTHCLRPTAPIRRSSVSENVASLLPEENGHPISGNGKAGNGKAGFHFRKRKRAGIPFPETEKSGHPISGNGKAGNGKAGNGKAGIPFPGGKRNGVSPPEIEPQ